MQVPADKYLLQDYRDDLRSPDAPQYLDTEIGLTPVKVVGAGLPKVNSKQRLLVYTHHAMTGAQAAEQIVTNSNIYRYYFVGAFCFNRTTVGVGSYIYDGTSGTSPGDATNDYLFIADHPATTGDVKDIWPPFAVPVKNGIRLTMGGGGSPNHSAIVYYIEERI